jgi:hypothetical protein
VEAYRNMMETIKGIQISSTTSVKDFVLESDEIQADLKAFVQGLKIVETRYNEDLTVEVDVEVTLVQVIARLKQSVSRYYEGGLWHEKSFNTITEYEKREVLRTTGSGAVPENFVLSRSLAEKNSLHAKPPIDESAVRQEQPAPEWAKRTLLVTGIGIPPDQVDDPKNARVMAERVAKVDAFNHATQQVYALQIYPHLSVQQWIQESPEFAGEIEEFLITGKVLDSRFLSDGTAEVDIELSLMNLWNIVKRSPRQDR